MTYCTIGTQTNLASRIQSQCEAGKILISHSTWALVKDSVEWRSKGKLQVKGIHHPVQVYEVVDEARSTQP
jgi:class 3 adenylate cyclase